MPPIARPAKLPRVVGVYQAAALEDVVTWESILSTVELAIIHVLQASLLVALETAQTSTLASRTVTCPATLRTVEHAAQLATLLYPPAVQDHAQTLTPA
ncbi:hypothetical protein N7466_008420 [Penicillium verhagenii]|uniref:uncharacterized protein n=1 Tax=Penicillium verhagenii TaxID=1562060 RepID=UPI0025459B00|nr:uncharacterized protein N7466_008420 [Penicillium verhagenii]KAJ5924233.1 hypothetical protein N7466_008420 [Penicillium verhagenii]